MRKHYLLFNSADECRDAVEVLESEGVGGHHLHAIAGLSQPLDGLPKATVWQKTELAKGLLLGLLAGALAGFCGGLLAIYYPPPGLQLGNMTLLLMTALGALFGLAVNALTKSREHNHGLDRFRRDMESGKVLLMADLPAKQSELLLTRVSDRCPDMQIRS